MRNKRERIKVSTQFTIVLTQAQVHRLRDELEDIGFGVDDLENNPDGSYKKQADDKWPVLSELADTLRTE